MHSRGTVYEETVVPSGPRDHATRKHMPDLRLSKPRYLARRPQASSFSYDEA